MSEPTMGELQTGDPVRHVKLGHGTVIVANGPTAVVRFTHGIEECIVAELQQLFRLDRRLAAAAWDTPLAVITRVQAAAIRSVNDTWGAFSPSRIELLPHQLWVCRQVVSTWPTRWLVADDVGLGKTVEAGMILSALSTRGRARRVLILCPAALVEQWQYRMRTMFGLRFQPYTTEADTPRAEFWAANDYIVASLQTMRLDSRGRQERLLESDPWDLLLVDEAHHLNADEELGPTLGYRLVRRMVDDDRVHSMVLFTGTPHRGKNFGFLSLLHLLRSDLFDPKKSLEDQLCQLPRVMIRNNKSNVTDLHGERLFQEPDVRPETYTYSPEERHFYDLMTEFIASGRAYASGLSSTQGRAVMLVLIAMQKLASSSVAAIRRALRGRLERLRGAREELSRVEAKVDEYRLLQQEGGGDELARMEEQLAELTSTLMLRENEEAALRELVVAADRVGTETKIQKILELLDGRFRDRAVLFFTEYKATQSLLMSALMARFGPDCVTFINGDGRADGVELPGGRIISLVDSRDSAAIRFNSGERRFLVSTEAAGEGIDLQERAYTLIHVDLPWNPMRLHQRVGRLNRYGQKHQVEVVHLRNPETVEALIWDKLTEKLERITLAHGHAMDEPEDMQQLVLGMTSPSLFNDLFAEANSIPREALSEWFDRKTARFGGQDAVRTVTELVGNARRFDFRQVSDRLPKVDLPDLKPFLEAALLLNGRRPREDEGGLSFLTPDAWRSDRMVLGEYKNLIFDRRDRAPDASKRLVGAGHRVLDQALKQAESRDAALTLVPADVHAAPLAVFQVRDRVTHREGEVRAIIVGVELPSSAAEPKLLTDWQVLLRLNALNPRRQGMNESSSAGDAATAGAVLERAERFLSDRLPVLDHQFEFPVVEFLALLWPDDSASR